MYRNEAEELMEQAFALQKKVFETAKSSGAMRGRAEFLYGYFFELREQFGTDYAKELLIAEIRSGNLIANVSLS